MMSSAHVKAIETLGELRTALLRYKSEAQGALDAAGAEIQRTGEWLQERLHYWQKELIRRQAILGEAEAAFNKCRAQAYRDPETGRTYVPDCSKEQAIVMQAKRLVQEAESELHTVRECIRRVEEAVASYQHQARQLAGTLNGDLLKGSELLSRSVTILQSYASGTGGGASAVGSDMGGASSASSSLPEGVSAGAGNPQGDPIYINCPQCGGSGNEDIECNPCGGTGHRFDGSDCPHCRGLAMKSINCWRCQGTGSVLEEMK